MAEITLFKVLGPNGKPMHGGIGIWSLPTADGPGEWMPRIDDIKPCISGYHLCRGAEHLIEWLGPEIYGAEIRGSVVEASNKVVAQEVRLIARVETWTDRTARLFAADCAERMLHLFEARYPDDPRPRQAIAAARAYARGEINDIARDDAGNDARAAARDAAWAYARDAAWAAASAAAKDAAKAAARDAAWAAASAATRDAAGDAAWDAAGDAAWAAANTAEQAWQVARLREYLRGEIK